MCVSLSARLPGHSESEWRLLPNPVSAFSGGPQEFHPPPCESSERDKVELLMVVPEKAEGTPVPGAGFSPEAVPGNEVERRRHGLIQLEHSTLTSTKAELMNPANSATKLLSEPRLRWMDYRDSQTVELMSGPCEHA